MIDRMTNRSLGSIKLALLKERALPCCCCNVLFKESEVRRKNDKPRLARSIESGEDMVVEEEEERGTCDDRSEQRIDVPQDVLALASLEPNKECIFQVIKSNKRLYFCLTCGHANPRVYSYDLTAMNTLPYRPARHCPWHTFNVRVSENGQLQRTEHVIAFASCNSSLTSILNLKNSYFIMVKNSLKELFLWQNICLQILC